MLKSKKIATIISYANLCVSFLTTVFFIPFLLKYVGDDYGVFSFSESIISWLTMLSTTFASCYVRFATIESKKTNEKPCQTNTIFLLALLSVSATALLVGGALFILFKTNVLTLSSFTASERELFYAIFLLAVIHSSLEMVLSFFTLYTTYCNYFVIVRGALLLNAILYPLLAVVALLSGGNMLVVIIVMFSVKIVLNICVMLFVFLKIGIKFKKFSFKEYKPLIIEIVIFSSFIFVNTIVETCNVSLDKILLGALFGTHVVSIYQLGMTYTTYINSISCAMTNNFIPEIHKLSQDNKMYEINQLFTKISIIQIFVLILIVGGFLSCGSEFVTLWIGEEYQDVYYIALILMASFAFEYSTSLSVEYQRSINKHKFRTIVYIASLTCNFLITFLLLRFAKTVNPIISCLIGTVFSEIVFKCIVLPCYNQRQLKLNYGRVIYGMVVFFLIMFFAFSVQKGVFMLIEPFIKRRTNLVSFVVKGLTFIVLYLPCSLFVLKKQFNLDFAKELFRRGYRYEKRH